jgi:hypothetical protein
MDKANQAFSQLQVAFIGWHYRVGSVRDASGFELVFDVD